MYRDIHLFQCTLPWDIRGYVVDVMQLYTLVSSGRPVLATVSPELAHECSDVKVPCVMLTLSGSVTQQDDAL